MKVVFVIILGLLDWLLALPFRLVGFVAGFAWWSLKRGFDDYGEWCIFASDVLTKKRPKKRKFKPSAGPAAWETEANAGAGWYPTSERHGSADPRNAEMEGRMSPDLELDNPEE